MDKTGAAQGQRDNDRFSTHKQFFLFPFLFFTSSFFFFFTSIFLDTPGSIKRPTALP